MAEVADPLREADRIIGAQHGGAVGAQITRLQRDPTDLTSPARYGWEPEQAAAIKATVAKDCTPSEFVMFLELAARYQLDPFARQIWAAKMGDDKPVAILVGRDGLLSIAERHDKFAGMDSDVGVEGDKLSVDRDTHEFIHEWGEDHLSGTIIGAWAMVWREDRDRPVRFFARYSEYAKEGSKFWQKFKSAMIVKCAESMALKRAFVISGLLVEEEVGPQDPAMTTPLTPEWGQDENLARFLQDAVEAANYAKKNAYRERKVLALLHGRTDDQRRVFAQELVDFIRQHNGSVPKLPDGVTLDEQTGRLRWPDEVEVIEGAEAVEVPADSDDDSQEGDAQQAVSA